MTKTIVVVTLNGYNSYNRSLIHHIKKTTTYEIFLGWDDKSGKKEDEYNFINSYNSLLKHFGYKINNFNGRWIKNPAKLGAIYWFSKNKEANYMWLIEDDVYIRNGNKFFDSYENKAKKTMRNNEKRRKNDFNTIPVPFQYDFISKAGFSH